MLRDDVITRSYNSVLVIVDRLIKYSYFILYNEEYSAEKLAHIVVDRLIRYYRILRTFITDRDVQFTSKF